MKRGISYTNEEVALSVLRVIHKDVVVFFFVFLGPYTWAYGGSQGWGPVGAVAAGLCQSYSNAGSEQHL